MEACAWGNNRLGEGVVALEKMEGFFGGLESIRVGRCKSLKTRVRRGNNLRRPWCLDWTIISDKKKHNNIPMLSWSCWMGMACRDESCRCYTVMAWMLLFYAEQPRAPLLLLILEPPQLFLLGMFQTSKSERHADWRYIWYIHLLWA